MNHTSGNDTETPLEAPEKKQSDADGHTLEIDMPSSDNASPEIPLEFPQKGDKKALCN